MGRNAVAGTGFARLIDAAQQDQHVELMAADAFSQDCVVDAAAFGQDAEGEGVHHDRMLAAQHRNQRRLREQTSATGHYLVDHVPGDDAILLPMRQVPTCGSSPRAKTRSTRQCHAPGPSGRAVAVGTGSSPVPGGEDQDAGGLQLQEMIVGGAGRREDKQAQQRGGEEIPVPQLQRAAAKPEHDGNEQQRKDNEKTPARAQGVKENDGCQQDVVCRAAAAAQLAEVVQKPSLAGPLEQAHGKDAEHDAGTGQRRRPCASLGPGAKRKPPPEPPGWRTW